MNIDIDIHIDISINIDSYRLNIEEARYIYIYKNKIVFEETGGGEKKRVGGKRN